MGAKTFVLNFVLLLTLGNSLKLPASFKKCNRNDANFSDCLSSAILHAIKQLDKPFPEYGLPRLDPFEIPINIENGNSTNGIRQIYSNMRVSGYSKVARANARFDFDTNSLSLELTFPEFLFESGIRIHGNLIVLPVNKSGTVTMLCTSNSTPPLSCDFESEDLCGWNHDLNHDFDWERLNYATPSGTIGTGPSYDHTRGPGKDGYYMYIESSARRFNDTARLISPVYDKSNETECFEFYYHMYGFTMGSLRVHLKLVNQSWDLNPRKALFVRNGNQGNKWHRGFIVLGTIDTDYQIVIEGVRGLSYVSDIAVDDMRVIKNCVPEDELAEGETTTEEWFTSEAPPKVETCENRCNTYDNQTSDVFITCDCDEGCYERSRCCPDYFDFCISSTPDDFTEETTEYIRAITDKTTTTSKTTTVKTTAVPTKLKTTSISPKLKAPSVPPKPKAPLVPSKPKTTSVSPKPQATLVSVLETTKPTTTVPAIIGRTIPFNTTQGKKEESKIVYVKPSEESDSEEIPLVTEIETPVPIKEIEIIDDYDSDKTFDHQKIEVVSNIRESNTKTIIFAVGVIFGVLFAMVGMAFVARRYQLCQCNRMRFHQSSNGDSQSDVRFLTSDEVLDFNLASEYDSL